MSRYILIPKSVEKAKILTKISRFEFLLNTERLIFLCEE